MSDLILRHRDRKHRPLFTETDMRTTLETMSAVCTPLYREVAHQQFTNTMERLGLTAKQVTDWFLRQQ